MDHVPSVSQGLDTPCLVSRTGSKLKAYHVIGPRGEVIESAEPGTLGGNRKAKIYGRLDCPSALRALPRGYAKHRVFFADRAAAIAAGYRPCGSCLREEYRTWKAGPREGTAYEWHQSP